MASSNTCRPEPTFSFTQGLIVGQLSVVLLVAAFIRFFIFGDPPSAEAAASQRASERRARTEAHRKSLLTLRGANRDHLGSQAGHANPQDSPITSQAQQPSHLSASGPFSPKANLRKSSVLRRPSTLTIASILNKTYYRVDSHQPESLDWFNVLIAQTIAQFRHDAQHDDAILTSLTKALNGTSRPDFVDEIRVTELSLGEGFPIFSNCRIIPVDEDGLGCTASAGDSSHAARLQARMDVDLSDMITLAVETKLLLNYPRRLAAVLPVALAVSVVRFSGTLSVSFVPSNPSQATPTKMIFAFLDDYRLDFSIRSLLGSRSRLQDVPKIAQLIESRLHRWFNDRAVEPRFQEIELPSLWPRMKNTRGGGSGGAAGSSAASGISAVAGGAPGAAAEDTLPPIGGPSIIPGSASAADRALLNKGRPANSLDALRRPESRDSKDSRETRDPRDVRDLRKEVETENWVERQQHPAIQLLAAASQQGQSSQSQSSPLSTTMRYRPPLSRHDDAFSMPGSLPDISMDPHG